MKFFFAIVFIAVMSLPFAGQLLYWPGTAAVALPAPVRGGCPLHGHVHHTLGHQPLLRPGNVLVALSAIHSHMSPRGKGN